MKKYINAAEHTMHNLNLDAYYDLENLLNTLNDNCNEFWDVMGYYEDDSAVQECLNIYQKFNPIFN